MCGRACARKRFWVTMPLALSLVAAAAAPAAASDYVGLGDSYAAGLGTGAYYEDSGDCYRSPKAYAAIVAARLGASLDFTACAGARIADVRVSQLRSLGEATAFVTLTIGGNDAGFGRVIASCALPRPWSCWGDVAAARDFIRETLPAELAEMLAAIAARAPGARVAVVGYPRAFDGEDCDPATFFSPPEEAMLDRTANLLARTERAIALARGLRFVDPRRAFDGHAICDPVEWLNGLSYPAIESYHPNPAGQRAYARLVLAALRSGP